MKSKKSSKPNVPESTKVEDYQKELERIEGNPKPIWWRSTIGIFAFLIVVISSVVAFSLLNHPQDVRQRAAGPSNVEQVPSVPDEILLRFKPGASDKVQKNTLNEFGLTQKEEIPHIGVKVLKVPEAARDHVIDALSHNPAVDFAEKNLIVKALDTIPNDPQYSINQWNLMKIQAPKAWDITTGSSSVVVAILDTGIASNLTDLSGKVVAGYNEVSASTNTTDLNGHGSWVSSVAAANTNNGTGMAGVTWASPLMPVKVCDDSGNCSTSAVAAGMVWAADHGASVINMSLGSQSSCGSTFQSGADYAWSKGLFLAAASGNEGLSYNQVDAPANCNHVVAVGATDSSDTRASYSNYGSQLAVVAPGSGIVCVTLSGGYGGCTGTSFASPHAAGVAALLMAKGATNTSAVSAMEKGVDCIGGSACPNQYYGYGRLNAYNSLQILTGITPPPPDTQAPTASISSPTDGSTVSGGINVNLDSTDNVGVTKVELYLDGILFATDTASPYSFFLDTTTLSNSNHTLVAKAYDLAGNVGTSSSVSITVSNTSPTPTPFPTLTPTPVLPTATPTSIIPTPTTGSADTTSPSVAITSPLPGSTVTHNDTITITATASDNVKVTKVEFYINGTLTCSDTTSPYSCSWKVPGAKGKVYTLSARAYDGAGNNSTSAINVTAK